VLLLDDVFSELDDTRRARVTDLCAEFDQVLVTAAVDADVPLPGPRIDVRREDDGAGSTLHPRAAAQAAVQAATQNDAAAHAGGSAGGSGS